MDLDRQNWSPNSRRGGDGAADETRCETDRSSNVFRVLLEYARTVIGRVKRVFDYVFTAKIRIEAPPKRDGTADEKRSENVQLSQPRAASGCDNCGRECHCDVHPKFAGRRPQTEGNSVEDCRCLFAVGSGNGLVKKKKKNLNTCSVI